MSMSELDLGNAAESPVASGKRRLLAAALLGGVLAHLPGRADAKAKRKPKQDGQAKPKPKRDGQAQRKPKPDAKAKPKPKPDKRGTAQVQATKKTGGGTVVIETGPTVVVEEPFDPNEPPFSRQLSSTATCRAGVAVGGGVKTVRPTATSGANVQDSYPSSPTEWTVTALGQEVGHGITPYVLCLV